MPIYTYTANKNKTETTGRLVLRGGDLILNLNQYADLTTDEYSKLSARYVLVPGMVSGSTPAGYIVPGLYDLLSPLALAQLVQEVLDQLPDTGGGSGGSGIVYRGAWVSGTTYSVNDVVTYGRSSFIRRTDGAGTTPPVNGATWGALAIGGDDGEDGTNGSTGPAVFPPFENGKAYAANQAITQGGRTYTAKVAFTSGATFSATNWNLLPPGNTIYRQVWNADGIDDTVPNAQVPDFIPGPSIATVSLGVWDAASRPVIGQLRNYDTGADLIPVGTRPTVSTTGRATVSGISIPSPGINAAGYVAQKGAAEFVPLTPSSAYFITGSTGTTFTLTNPTGLSAGSTIYFPVALSNGAVTIDISTSAPELVEVVNEVSDNGQRYAVYSYKIPATSPIASHTLTFSASVYCRAYKAVIRYGNSLLTAADIDSGTGSTFTIPNVTAPRVVSPGDTTFLTEFVFLLVEGSLTAGSGVVYPSGYTSPQYQGTQGAIIVRELGTPKSLDQVIGGTLPASMKWACMRILVGATSPGDRITIGVEAVLL